MDDVKAFYEFIKSNGGHLNRSVTINKKSMKTSWIPLHHFQSELKRKIIKLVRDFLHFLCISNKNLQLIRPAIEKDCKKYGSVKLKKKSRKEVPSETEAAYDSRDTSNNK